MRQEFIRNLQELIMDNEGIAWQLRNGQDQEAAQEKVLNDMLKNYYGNPVADTRYYGAGAYANLDPQQQAAIDMYIMDNKLI